MIKTWTGTLTKFAGDSFKSHNIVVQFFGQFIEKNNNCGQPIPMSLEDPCSGRWKTDDWFIKD